MSAMIEKGKYGQWIVADIIDGYRVHRQYYDCTKAEALRQFKAEMKHGKKRKNPLRAHAKYWVGITHSHTKEVFAYSGEPTERSFGSRYVAVIGPCSSKLSAEIMAKHGGNNPHMQTVTEANRLARKGRPWLRSQGFNV